MTIRREATRVVIDSNGVDGCIVKETGVLAAGAPGVSGLDVATVGQLPSLPLAATAWASFPGLAPDGVKALDSGYNVASVTRSGVGRYIVQFSTPMANANYIALFTMSTTNGSVPYLPVFGASAINTAVAPTINGFEFFTPVGGATGVDCSKVGFVVFGGK